MQRLFSAVIIFILTVFIALPAQAVVLDRVVAVINNEAITWLELYEAMRIEFAPKLKDMDEAAQKEALANSEKDFLDSMIIIKLELQEAGRLRLTASDKEVDSTIANIRRKYNMDEDAFMKAIEDSGTTWEFYRRSLKEQITIRRLIDRQVRSKMTDMSAKGEAVEASYHLKQVYINIMAEEAELEAKVKAVYEALGSGADFESVAVRMSEGPNADSGGDLGVIEASVLSDKLKDVVAKLQEGQVSPPVKTAKGIHILKMERIVSSGDREAEMRFKKLYSDWVKELRGNARIDIRL